METGRGEIGDPKPAKRAHGARRTWQEIVCPRPTSGRAYMSGLLYVTPESWWRWLAVLSRAFFPRGRGEREGTSLARRSLHPHPNPLPRCDDAREREFELPDDSSSRRPSATKTEALLLYSLGLFGVLLVWPMAAGGAPFAYVTNAGGVSVIDTASNAVTATVPVSSPYELAVSPDGTRVYVTNFADDTLSIINTATNQVEAIVPGLVRPAQVAVDPTGSRAYIAGGVIPGYVAVLDTATNTVINTIPVGSFPFGVAVSPDGSHVYVTNTYSNDERCPGFGCVLLTVSVIDTAQAREIHREVVGAFPGGIAVNPTGTRVYVAVGQPPEGSGARLAVINPTTNRVLEWIPVGGDSLAVAPSGDYVYTAGGRGVSVVATNCDMTVANIRPNGSADAVAITPDGRRLYVTNALARTVLVIDTATNTVIDTLAVRDGAGLVVIGPEVIGTSPTPTIGRAPRPTATRRPRTSPCGDPCVVFQSCRAPCGARIVPGYCAVDCRCVAIGTETPTPTPITPSPTLPPMSHTATPTVTYTPSCACTMTQTGTRTRTGLATRTPTPTPVNGDSCRDACMPGEDCSGFLNGRFFSGLCFRDAGDCRCFEQGTITPTHTPTPPPTATGTSPPTPTETATHTRTRTPTGTPTPSRTATRTATATGTPPPTPTRPPTPTPTLTPPPTHTPPPSPTKAATPADAPSGGGCTLAPVPHSGRAAAGLLAPFLVWLVRRLRRAVDVLPRCGGTTDRWR